MRYTYPYAYIFLRIGGSAMGSLAFIAQQAGYDVSGSDAQNSASLDYLHSHGITNVYVGQTEEAIDALHAKKPIDWLVYSAAVPESSPELQYTNTHHIRTSKRDDFLNYILTDKHLKLVAIAGTHGKSTTTAMSIWLFKQLELPISYCIGAKIGFGDSGQLDPASKYFIYECDEFDRNFLAFYPYLSLISGIAWDHHEIFPSQDDYNQAFREFLDQSEQKVLWEEDYDKLQITDEDTYSVLNTLDDGYSKITLTGEVNRRNAWLVIDAVHTLTNEPVERLIELMNEFPGLSRRMEQLVPNLYTDYAHNPEKIQGAMQTALEIAKEKGQKVAVVYEPLTNRRMHYTRTQHRDIFNGASALYWVPSYLAREDPEQTVLTPAELIKDLNPELQSVAQPMEFNDQLKTAIQSHLDANDLVLCLSGGGGNSLDEWLRTNFTK